MIQRSRGDARQRKAFVNLRNLPWMGNERLLDRATLKVVTPVEFHLTGRRHRFAVSDEPTVGTRQPGKEVWIGKGWTLTSRGIYFLKESCASRGMYATTRWMTHGREVIVRRLGKVWIVNITFIRMLHRFHCVWIQKIFFKCCEIVLLLKYFIIRPAKHSMAQSTI